MTTRKTAPKNKPATGVDVDIIIAIKSATDFYTIDPSDSFGDYNERATDAADDGFTLHKLTVHLPIPEEKEAAPEFASESLVDLTE